MIHVRMLLALCVVPLLSGVAACSSASPKAAGASATCEVHGDPLVPDTVPIAYGRILVEPGLAAARKSSFPHANTVEYGGCVVWDPNVQTAAVTYCPACRAAEAAYVAEKRGAETKGQ